MSYTRVLTLIQGSQKVNERYYTHALIKKSFIITCVREGLINIVEYDYNTGSESSALRHIFTLTDLSKQMLAFRQL
jgi:hypothetical protein